MAGAARWKGSVKFGPLLMVPVIAQSAVSEVKFSFNQHHAECGGRLRQTSMVCEGCGELVAKDQVVRGFSGIPGIDEEYIESLEAEKSALLDLEGLVPADQIDPRYYQKSYDLQPDAGGEKGYVLFLRLMEKAKKVGVGRIVMGGKEYIVTIRPRDGVLAMELMYWPEEIKSNAGAKSAIEGVEVSDRELEMGEQLVKFLSRDFVPEEYKNEYAAALGAYLNDFVAGKQPAALPKAKPLPKAMSMEDALAATLAALEAEGPKRKSKAAAA